MFSNTDRRAADAPRKSGRLDRRAAVTAALSVALTISVVMPPVASGRGTGLEATGVLRVVSTKVGAEPGLALMYPDATTTSTIQAIAKAARRGGPRPVGRLVWFGPMAGAPVRSGQVIARIDPGGGRLFAQRQVAARDVMSTRVGLIDDARSKILDARAKLLDARAKLLDARTKAQAQFTKKVAEGRSAERKLLAAVAGLQKQVRAVEIKLARAREGLAGALAALAAAESLPDSDPTKLAKVAAAQQAVAQARAGVAALSAALGKLRVGLAGARTGLAKLQGGLVLGSRAFAQAMTKIATALAQMATALDKLDQQYRVLGHQREALAALAQAARWQGAVIGLLNQRYAVRAPRSGFLLSQGVETGQMVFAGQTIAEVAPKGRLKLDLYVPLDEVRAVVPGGRATVRVDGVSRTFRGRVHLIDASVEFAPTNAASTETHLQRTVRVELDVDDPTGVLKPGMPADAVVTGTT